MAKSRKSRKAGLGPLGIGLLVTLLLAVGGGIGLWLSLPDVGGLTKENPGTTAFIDLRRQEAAAAGHPFTLRWTWRPLGKISPFLARAVVYAEDAKFWKHEGVDWDSVKQNAERNWEEKSLARGGSTLTQQLAKNLYLSPSRNPVRKVRELFIARRLERSLPKSRILELYLNVAEWGDGVFGAEAAARRYYGVSASELSPVQAARLAVALPNPLKRSPQKKSAKLDAKALRLVRAMHRAGLVDETQLAEAMATLRPAAGGSATASARTRLSSTEATPASPVSIDGDDDELE